MHALLIPYLDAADLPSEDAHLRRLIETHGLPLIRRVVTVRLDVFGRMSKTCVQKRTWNFCFG